MIPVNDSPAMFVFFSYSQAISVSRFREEMDRYLACRVEEMSKKSIGKFMRHLIQRHLGWIIVWGCIFGVLSGLATQALRLSLNFNFQIRSLGS